MVFFGVECWVERRRVFCVFFVFAFVRVGGVVLRGLVNFCFGCVVRGIDWGYSVE